MKQQKAKNMLEKQFTILASNKDIEIFFKEIIYPRKPNNSLKKAAVHFQKTVLNK